MTATYNVRYLRGSLLNHLARGTVTVTNEDSLFPKARLYDGHPDQPFRAGSVVANFAIDHDGNLVYNGGFETSTLDGWTDASTGTGAISEETTNFDAGAKALNCDGNSSGVGAAYQDVSVAAGERLTVEARMRGTVAASATGELYVQNLQTGEYLTSGGTWTATPTALFTAATDSYASKTQAFQVDPYSTCLSDVVTLRITCQCQNDGSAYFDEVYMFPTVNFVGVFGHNLSPVVTPEFHSSTDAFVANDTTEATLVLQHPSFYAYLTTAKAIRWWQLLLSGTPVEKPTLGEVVVGYAETLTAVRADQGGVEVGFVKDQVRYSSLSGKKHVTGAGGKRRRLLKWKFKLPTDAATIEVRDEVVERSEYGERPLVLAPDDHDTDQTVVHGTLTEEWGYKVKYAGLNDADLEVEEDPFHSGVF